MASKFQEVIGKYKNFVKNNPETTSQIESVARVLSYIVPGSSPVVSELLYSASNLLVLLNDQILRQANNIKFKLPLPNKRLCQWLTILEYIEVFLELSADQLGGEFWHWVVVLAIQLTKAVLRYFLLSRHESGVLFSPAMAPLKRKRELQPPSEENMVPSESEANLAELEKRKAEEERQEVTINFTLKTSGRVVRSLAATPSNNQRSWQVPQYTRQRTDVRVTQLDETQRLGEYLYTLRPLIHLISLYKLGGKRSWKPYIIAGCVDVSSLLLLGNREQFNHVERRELRRRTTLLVLYLLRSPFYDKFTKARLVALLTYISNNVPLLRLISSQARMQTLMSVASVLLEHQGIPRKFLGTIIVSIGGIRTFVGLLALLAENLLLLLDELMTSQISMGCSDITAFMIRCT